MNRIFPGHTALTSSMRMLSFIAAWVLLIAVSIEIISGDHTRFSSDYLIVQLIVCCIFLLDFGVRWTEAPDKWRFFGRNILFLLLSIPFLSIVDWSGMELSRDWSMAIGMTPLLRAFLAMYIVVRWLIEGRVRKLLVAYIFTVVVFTYIAALIFFDYEALVNPHLHGFGNALWWAWMNVTTVGAAIFPVTTIGKIICVLLPLLGMLMLPIFTIYITSIYTKKN